MTWQRFPELVMNGVTFKWTIALLDTPVFYAAVWFLGKRLRLAGAGTPAAGEERRGDENDP